jgi:hypothetical protein
MAMMIAATLVRDVDLRDAAPGKSAAAGTSGLRAGTALNAEALFLEARTLATSRPDLLAIIEDARASKGRGVLGTVDAVTGKLGPKEVRVFRFQFAGDSDAAAGVASPADAEPGNDSDIDLYVADDRNTPVCISEAPGIPELCRWTPRRSGTFLVRIENRRTASTPFLLMVR